MKQSSMAKHAYFVDQNHDNIGGTTTGPGIAITWFNPKEDGDGRQNGAIVEDVIQVAIDRIDYLNRPEGSPENAGALRALREALQLLEARQVRLNEFKQAQLRPQP